MKERTTDKWGGLTAWKTINAWINAALCFYLHSLPSFPSLPTRLHLPFSHPNREVHGHCTTLCSLITSSLKTHFCSFLVFVQIQIFLFHQQRCCLFPGSWGVRMLRVVRGAPLIFLLQVSLSAAVFLVSLSRTGSAAPVVRTSAPQKSWTLSPSEVRVSQRFSEHSMGNSVKAPLTLSDIYYI